MSEWDSVGMNASGGDPMMRVFKKYVGNFKALPWVGLAISLVAVFGLQISTFISLGLSLAGSQHRYRYSQIIVDPIVDFTSDFIIMGALFLGPILFSVGCVGLLLKRIFKNYRKEENSGSDFMRPLLSIIVVMFFALVTCAMIVLIGAILFGLGMEYGQWQDSLPFPEALRRVTP